MVRHKVGTHQLFDEMPRGIGSPNMATNLSGALHCPFREFHGCRDGEEGSKGFSCMVSHLKRVHFCTDERKSVLRETIERCWNVCTCALVITQRRYLGTSLWRNLITNNEHRNFPQATSY